MPKKINRGLWWALPLVVALSACGSGTAPSPTPPPGAKKAGQSALTVSLATADQVTWPTAVPASGEVSAWQESTIGLEVGGHRLVKVFAQVGDSVQKGQVLAQLNTDALTVELASAQASLAEALAAQAQALATLARSKKLAAAGGVSDQDLTLQQTAYTTAQARVKLQQAQVAKQQLNLARATLVAPDAGIISARVATEGSIPQPGAELFKLIRQGRLEWRAEVSASRIHLVQLGQHVTLRANDGSIVAGVVRQVAPSLNSASRTGIVYVDLPANPNLKAGMHLSGDIVGVAETVVVVPLAAVSLRDGRSYVFSIEGGKAKAHEVQVGQSSGDQVVITSGLTAGTAVVRQGAGFLKAGDTVTVVAQGAAK